MSRGPKPPPESLPAYEEAREALDKVRLARRIIDNLAELPRAARGDFTLIQMTILDVVRDALAPDALQLAEALLELEAAYPEIDCPE